MRRPCAGRGVAGAAVGGPRAGGGLFAPPRVRTSRRAELRCPSRVRRRGADVERGRARCARDRRAAGGVRPDRAPGDRAGSALLRGEAGGQGRCRGGRARRPRGASCGADRRRLPEAVRRGVPSGARPDPRNRVRPADARLVHLGDGPVLAALRSAGVAVREPRPPLRPGAILPRRAVRHRCSGGRCGRRVRAADDREIRRRGARHDPSHHDGELAATQRVGTDLRPRQLGAGRQRRHLRVSTCCRSRERLAPELHGSCPRQPLGRDVWLRRGLTHFRAVATGEVMSESDLRSAARTLELTDEIAGAARRSEALES
jgi:hypothetical protein